MFKRPLRFRPYYKSVLWGGNRIADYRNEDIDINKIGESWEISAIAPHDSVVIDDPDFAGMTLSQLCELYPGDFLGTDVVAHSGKRFPLLIKIIDANQNLSVQVHPDDALAKARHGGLGKSEMWYIIQCTPDANIYTGLAKPFSKEDYERRLADNTIMDVVGCHKSAPGQFYYVPAGTLHAIGAGNLLAEVQESSDITYRVYDYGRVDADGNLRQLHTELAKDAIDYRFPNAIEPTARTFDTSTRGAVNSEFFRVDYLSLSEDQVHSVDPRRRSFLVLMISEGDVTFTLADGTVLTYQHGNTLLIPASMPPFTLSGTFKALLVTCENC